MKYPNWSDNRYPQINFQDLCYYSEPNKKPTLDSLDVPALELLAYFDRLGIPFLENKRDNVAVDVVCDGVSIAMTHKKSLEEKSGVIFCAYLKL
ncbi:unnamed protein product [Vicia faba]|uniref:Uncharacterized protein n=1 Tax=Vicia faba TaxID=3906 RepID=A0AAV0ZG74_VICFA|nr:unnamed protein product [Vicia faba]